MEDPVHFDHSDAFDLWDDEIFVIFVVSEHMEWEDNSKPNVCRGKYLRCDLTLETLPPETMRDHDAEIVEPYMKRFKKSGWEMNLDEPLKAFKTHTKDANRNGVYTITTQ